ncbi:MAG: hypothetical protein ABSG98_11235 [Anaerolineales bacterium]
MRFGGMGLGLSLLTCVVSLIVLVIGAWIWWRILAKTGYGGPLGLLMLVPIANLVLLFVLALGEWPIEKELQRSEAGR